MRLRRFARARAALAALTLLGTGLEACRQRDDVGAPPCPRVAVLADAQHLVRYRDGPGRDLTDILYEADLGRITGECIYKKRNTSVTVAMKLTITAKRGPADRDRVADLDYFVAIVDTQGGVLARQEFSSVLEFRPEQTQAGAQEELEQIIPLKKDQPGSDFDVLIGFKLTPEQLQRNRAGR